MNYYGFRYYSGRDSTWANTGRIAGELEIFQSLPSLKNWLDDENLCNPCGLGGGERIRVSRKEAIKLIGKEEFERRIDFIGLDERMANYWNEEA